ncbi:hypothetical protein KEM54_001370 [Ascosphaera aggregata]|nr:hypothetical protein KEM54_001370 [Ascosphaera aggregata]
MLSILRKARLKDKELRVLMLGLDNAGKTTIVKKIMKEDVMTVSPTLGFNIKTIDFDGNYFEKTDALIWVVDATDRLRTEDCREELAGLLLEERLMGSSLLIFLNKVDVDGCMSVEEVKEIQHFGSGKTLVGYTRFGSEHGHGNAAKPRVSDGKADGLPSISAMNRCQTEDGEEHARTIHNPIS